MNDAVVADGLKAGDPNAFRTLYENVGPGVFTYLWRMLERREMAEELAQDTFLTAIRKIAFFQPRIDGGLKAWVFRIATHRAIDVLRRERKMQLVEEVEESAAPDTPETAAFGAEVSAALAAAVSGLPPAQRMMFLLKEQEGLSLLEISRVCGCSIGAVKQSLFRARAALKEELG